MTIDLTGKTTLADAMIVASGTSQRHISSMADKLIQRLKSHGIGGVRAEGTNEAEWVLIDAGDVIVHLFKPETRTFYSLERLWEAPAGEQKAAGG